MTHVQKDAPFPARPSDDRTLHMATCGSVDDGKSTLIGRLLVDAGAVLADQLDQVAVASKRRGLADLDLSLLTDGLRAEREQGITIDVAWRTFRTEAGRFSLADSPGHVQYTCNMAVAASGADVAVVLLDAKKGVVAQTRRHVLLSWLVGVRTFVVAVNKMDAVGYSAERFAEVRDEVTHTITRLAKLLPGPAPRTHVVPLSALTGDNVVFPSSKMPWYDGLPLLRLLERVPRDGADSDGLGAPSRLAVQWVARPSDATLRAYAGRVARGSLGVGDEVVVLPSGHGSTITKLETLRGPADRARAGESVTVTLADAIDITRGDVIAHASSPPRIAQNLRVDLVVLSRRPLGEGTSVLVKQGTRTVRGRLEKINGVYDLDGAERGPVKPVLAQNDVADVSLVTSTPLVFDSFEESRAFGSAIVVCPTSGDTLAATALR